MFKDREKQKEYDRERKRKSRTNDKDVLPDTLANVLPEMFEGKPRHLTLSDGQAFDREYRPNPNRHIPEMIANEERLGKGTDTEKAAKLLMVIRAMDKEVRGLDGKVNLLTMTRYGVSGQTLAELKPMFE